MDGTVIACKKASYSSISVSCQRNDTTGIMATMLNPRKSDCGFAGILERPAKVPKIQEDKDDNDDDDDDDDDRATTAQPPVNPTHEISSSSSSSRHAEEKVSVWIQVDEGSGNEQQRQRQQQKFSNHIFATRSQGLSFVRCELEGSLSPPLPSPFAPLLGWNLELYCSSKLNSIDYYSPKPRLYGYNLDHLNAAGVQLGSQWSNGLTLYYALSGTIFVTGRRLSDGRPLTKNTLQGVLTFIQDCKQQLYNGTLDVPLQETLEDWAEDYKSGTYKALTSTARDIYNCWDWKTDAIDHRQ